MSGTDILDTHQVNQYLTALPEWRRVPGAIAAVFETKTAASTIELFADIARAAELDNHHPDVDWRYNRLFVTTMSHDVGGAVTTRDIALATKISEFAQKHSAKARVDLIGVVEVAVDTDDQQAISSQWAVGLGYNEASDRSLVDPNRRLPAIWFQQTQTPNANRLHLDIWGAYSESKKVLDELQSQQVQLDESSAPSFVVVTDHQGNRFCICTEKDR
ncbi:4a-hydroxytetrahydrobiopterin dehydratase [Glutamicibacter sp.]|uniref:4a-hydroxytetrahydrobiopterin dehydratase n=1 Tax=Glutamicibacter sp. TaxID=1931995 RepID=UPI002FDFD811